MDTMTVRKIYDEDILLMGNKGFMLVDKSEFPYNVFLDDKFKYKYVGNDEFFLVKEDG